MNGGGCSCPLRRSDVSGVFVPSISHMKFGNGMYKAFCRLGLYDRGEPVVVLDRAFQGGQGHGVWNVRVGRPWRSKRDSKSDRSTIHFPTDPPLFGQIQSSAGAKPNEDVARRLGSNP